MSTEYASYNITTDYFNLINTFSLEFSLSTDAGKAAIQGDSNVIMIMAASTGWGDLYYTLNLGDIDTDPKTSAVDEITINADGAQYSIYYSSGERTALANAYRRYTEQGAWSAAVEDAMQSVVNYALSSSVSVGNLMNFKKVKAPEVKPSAVSIFENDESISAGISISTGMTTTTSTSDGGY